MGRRANSAATCVGMVCWLALGGCAAMQVKPGRRVKLVQTPVVSIEVSLPNGPGMAPGQESPLVVTLRKPDGKVLRTVGNSTGEVMWQDLKITATVVTVDANGVIALSQDPRVSDGKTGHVTIAVPSHPDVKPFELDIPFRYDIAYVSNFSGAPGSSGVNGLDGANGMDGTPGSIDSPWRGADGANGADGGNGQDGGTGGNAPAVEVKVTVRGGSRPLLQASVAAAGKQELYLVDPRGGSLTVRADGGAGGSGGRGGRGGLGGHGGGVGTPDGASGDGGGSVTTMGRNGNRGADGRNGMNGATGRGGQITVTYDPHARAYLTAIHLSNRNGPMPVFRKQAMAPLW